jgi:hypothetical protein
MCFEINTHFLITFTILFTIVGSFDKIQQACHDREACGSSEQISNAHYHSKFCHPNRPQAQPRQLLGDISHCYILRVATGYQFTASHVRPEFSNTGVLFNRVFQADKIEARFKRLTIQYK